MITPPLKLKYRNPNKRKSPCKGEPPEGTWVYSSGKQIPAKPRTNSGVAAKKKLAPRRKAYGPF